MSLEKPSSPGHRTEVEVSVLPQVAALASALTTLFNGLGISQATYAVRVNLDKSQVSRFLNGRRIASAEFLDRLFAEVERQHHPVTAEVKERVRRYRSDALRVQDPRQYELEELQAESGRLARDRHRLDQQCEALSMLLDQKEAAARTARSELLQLQSDWIAERVESEAASLLSRRSQHHLEATIAELRHQLAEAAHQRDLAEQRCTELTQQLEELEEKIAIEREESADRSLSLDALQVALHRLWAGDETHEAARELTEAAYSLPVQPLWEMVEWLTSASRPHEAKRLLLDAARVRPIGQVSELFTLLDQPKREPDQRQLTEERGTELVAEVCALRTFEGVLHLVQNHSGSLATQLAVTWTQPPRPVEEVTRMLLACSALRLGGPVEAITGQAARRPVAEVAQLLRTLLAAGEMRIAADLIGRAPGSYEDKGRQHRRLFNLAESCLELPESDALLRSLFRRLSKASLADHALELAATKGITGPRLRIFQYLMHHHQGSIHGYFASQRENGQMSAAEVDWQHLVRAIRAAEGRPSLRLVTEGSGNKGGNDSDRA